METPRDRNGKEIKIGDKVKINGSTATIINGGEKDGRVTCDLLHDDGDVTWAYTYQVEKI